MTTEYNSQQAMATCSRPFVCVRNRIWLILVFLVSATLAAFWDAGKCDFVSLDDFPYVTEQPMVRYGLRFAAVEWAFTVPHGGNWHPLTSLSHMLDCEIFGLSPGPHHWVNLGWHVLNVSLVFLVWRKLTGAVWRPALVAALFALHPLRVESVVWISERKDVLSTFFWLLGLWSYARYVGWQGDGTSGASTQVSGSTFRSSFLAPRSFGFYWLTLGCCALGLLAKPMVVTFPCTLLLLDFWPLRRWSRFNAIRLVWEKVPFFVLSGISAVMTSWFQQSVGATSFGDQLSLVAKAGNALVSYVRYLGKTFWPESLVVLYPHPGHWPWWTVLGAGGIIVLVTWIAVHEARRRPWLGFGWFWFLGTLVPVIGLMQVGTQSMADRYTYVPLLGIFTLLAWGGAELIQRWPRSRGPVLLGVALGLGACFWLTRQQVLIWRDGVSLLERSVEMTKSNPHARMELAEALHAAGRPDEEVVAQYRCALEFAPESPRLLDKLAEDAARYGRLGEARSLLEKAKRFQPHDAQLEVNFGSLALMEGRWAEAEAHYREALRLDPRQTHARQELAGILLKRGQLAAAKAELEAATQVDRWDFVAYHRLGLVFLAQADRSAARSAFERALWINPGYKPAEEQLRQLDGRANLSP